MKGAKLPITEELDFAYLLELMPPLHNVPEYALLPELFSTIGHESLIDLCRYAGGEIVKIPTVDELSSSISALQLFYDVEIRKRRTADDVPTELADLFNKIVRIYHARDCESQTD